MQHCRLNGHQCLGLGRRVIDEGVVSVEGDVRTIRPYGGIQLFLQQLDARLVRGDIDDVRHRDVRVKGMHL